MSLLIIAAVTMMFTMVARRLSSTIITAPMFFLGLGFLLAESGFMPPNEAETLLHLVAEVALIVLLFLDAAQIDVKTLVKRHTWPQRMLLLGLPLSILLGTFVAWLLLPDSWPLAAVALMAALLAPTDAALGQPVLSNPDVPERVRQGLTVESGLNDGLALPAVLLFASLAGSAMVGDDRNWFAFAALQLVLGPLTGVAFGYVGGKVLLLAKARRWTSDVFEGIGAIALASATYLAAGEIGGNGFIAAFVAGLTFGNIVAGRCRFVFEFTESEGQLLAWASFLLLGMVMVPEVIGGLTWPILALILLSLIVIRPVAIWVSLLGSDAPPVTRLFFGWFGPRGLATALFALLVVPVIDHEIADIVLVIAINTVWISAVLHGVTAAPVARRYSALLERRDPGPEAMPAAQHFAEHRPAADTTN